MNPVENPVANLIEKERDLFTINHGEFRFEDRPKIMAEALRREAEGATWTDIVRDFHTGPSRYWGYEPVRFGHPATKKPKSDQEKRARNLLVFLWTVFQSFIVLKGIIMYFGLNYSIENEDTYGGRESSFYGWGLAISLLISFGGLIFFAIRKSRGEESN